MLVLAGVLAGCKDASVDLPETGVAYYPVAVGNYWIYSVTDSTWTKASRGVPSVPSTTTYNFRETITGTFTDAAGQPAYRLVRAKKDAGATAYRDDSVFVLSATPQTVVLNRNNVRTVELIFPVKDSRTWNFNAYNNSFNDTITAETRRYSRAGQAFTTPAVTGVPTVTYPTTVFTLNTGLAAESSLLTRKSYQQVFAQGIGPVYRRRDYFINFNYPSGNQQVYPANSYDSGFSRRETLIEYGPK